MENLRETAEKELHDCLESELGTPVELISPDGKVQIYSANNPTELLSGQVKQFSRDVNPDTGETIIVDNPAVTLRISSLDRIPAPGESWFIRMPVSPVAGSPKKSFTFKVDRAPEKGTDLGIFKILPQSCDDEAVPVVESES